jgi:hypothetical protein
MEPISPSVWRSARRRPCCTDRCGWRWGHRRHNCLEGFWRNSPGPSRCRPGSRSRPPAHGVGSGGRGGHGLGVRAGTGESGTVRVCPLERLVTRKTPRASRLHGCRRPGGPSTPGWRPPGCLDGRSCRPRRWPAWPRRVGGVRSRPHPRSPGIPCAVQGPCRWPSPHPQAALPGDELARVGRQLASARELDGLVHEGGDRGLAGGASRARPGAGSPGTRPWRS